MNEIVLQKPSKKSIYWAGCIGALIGMIAFAPIWSHYQGQYMDFGDYFIQYVPFIKELKRMIKSGSLAWSWNSGLGDNFVGAYSYYTVFNPFAWLVAVFPDKYILYGTMFATILKLSICMMSAMLYIRNFCKKDIYALIGALLYTFSGFTLVNTYFYLFLDIIAIFPFVLYGLEKVILEKKRTTYIVALVINAAVNYYLFVSTVLIVVIYVIFRLELYRISALKKHQKIIFDILVSSFIGTGMAFFSLIPSVNAIMGSGKATENIGSKLLLMYWPQNILERIRTLVAPIESGHYRAFFDASIWSSTGMYLPVFGCVLVIQRCTTKKDWLKKICIFLTICYFVPILNAAFSLYSSANYTRWLYGPVLLFSLATILVLEEVENSGQTISKKIVFCVASLAMTIQIVPAIIYLLYQKGISVVNRFASACETEYFMGMPSIVIILILTFINYILLGYIASAKKNNSCKILICVMLACCMNFFVYNAINYERNNLDHSVDYFKQKALEEGFENNEPFFEYRVDYPGKIANYSLFKNLSSINYFNSLQNKKTSRFAAAVGIGETPWDISLGIPILGNEYVNALLSVEYYYDYDGQAKIPQGFHCLKNENGVDIYENLNYIPMGFTYDTFCLEQDLEELLPEERAKVMVEALCVNAEDKNKVREYLKYELDLKNEKEISQIVLERKESSCHYFKGTSKGFEAQINLEKDNIVFFSIPNDLGWEISVNGKPAEVIEVNYGLLGICCNEGVNTISAIYHTPGWKLGVGCSVACLMIWIIYEDKLKKIIIRGQTDDRFVDTIEETSGETP